MTVTKILLEKFRRDKYLSRTRNIPTLLGLLTRQGINILRPTLRGLTLNWD